MYERLLLQCDGGIENLLDKMEQAENTTSIIIGIGGAGIDALREVKKKVYNNVKADSWEMDEKPIYNRIQFLAIDSDSYRIDNPIRELDLSRDFIDIGNYDGCLRGTGGVRQIGKKLLSERASDVYYKLKQKIVHGIAGVSANDLNIYIMAGLGGGTGSGCFIDVCYILRRVLDDLGFYRAILSGFLFLPDVYLAKTGFPQVGLQRKIIEVNSYATLKELDYLMDIRNNGDTYEQQYHVGISVLENVPPVDFCYLLSAAQEDGTLAIDGYKSVLKNVSDYILNFVTETKDMDMSDTNLSYRRIMCHLMGAVKVMKEPCGTNYTYLSLQVAERKIPRKEIGTYLGCKVFEKIADIRTNRPSRDDVNHFCDKIGLVYEVIVRDVRRNTRSLLLDATAFAGVGIIDEASLHHYCERWMDSCTRIRQENIRVLGSKLDKYTIVQEPKSIIGRIFYELIRLLSEPQYGPYYAFSLLNNVQNLTVDNVLSGIMHMTMNKLQHAIEQHNYLWNCVCDAQRELMSSTFLLRTSKKRRYLATVIDYYNNEDRIQTYKDIADLLHRVQCQLEELKEEYFRRYIQVVDRLIATFEENTSYYNYNCGEMNSSTYIINIETLMPHLNQIIENDNFLVRDFNRMMLDDQDSWLIYDADGERISKRISEFIYNKYNVVMNKSMLQYLEEKYMCTGMELAQKISTHEVNQRLQHGTTMFWLNRHTFTNDFVKLDIALVPSEYAFVEAAGMSAAMVPDMQVASTTSLDNMRMIRLLAGVPVHAYHGLKNCKQTYECYRRTGVHLFEESDKNWKNLPEPIPASLGRTYFSEQEIETFDGILELYDKAKAAGVIDVDVWNNQKMVLRTFDEVKSEWIVKGALGSRVDNEREAKDNFVRRPIIQQFVIQEMKKIEIQ